MNCSKLRRSWYYTVKLPIEASKLMAFFDLHKPVNVTRYLSLFMLFPRYSSKNAIKKSEFIKFLTFAVFGIIGNIKYTILLFKYNDPFWRYYLGDTTFVYGSAQDYLLISIYAWSWTMWTSYLFILNFYLKRENKWLERLQDFEQVVQVFESSADKTIRQKTYKKLRMAIFTSKIILLLSDSAYLVFSWGHLHFGLRYTLTIGVTWLVHGLTCCTMMTNLVDFSIFIFSVICYDMRLRCNELRRAVNRFTQSRSDPAVLGKIMFDYAMIRQETVIQNRFWRRLTGSVFFGCAAGFSFQLYEYFFAHLDFTSLSCITFWGSFSFVNGVMLTILAPSMARQGVSRTRGILPVNQFVNPSDQKSVSSV